MRGNHALRAAGAAASLAALAFALALGVGAARAEPAPAPARHIAVLEFTAAKGLDIDRHFFSDRVRAELLRRPTGLMVMTQENTVQLLAAQGKTLADCEGECEVETAKKLGAEFVISGRITKAGSRLALTMRLHSTGEGRLLKSVDALGKTPDELIDASSKAIEALLAALPGSGASSGAGGKTRLTVETDPTALALLLDGEKQASPLALEVAPGEHEVQVDAPCFAKTTTVVTLAQGEVRALRLTPRPRMAALKVSVHDSTGNDLEASATLDGRPLGAVPGAFSVPLCARQLSVDAGPLAAEETLALKEGVTTALQLRLYKAGPKAGTRRVEPKTGLIFVALPPGKSLGRDGQPQVQLDPFELGETEVTTSAYQKCVDAAACKKAHSRHGGFCNAWYLAKKGDHPINCVEPDLAEAFCAWIGGRLPTRDEWEYAATGGDVRRKFPWGDEDPSGRACWNGDGSDGSRFGRALREGTCPVAARFSGDSSWGLHDLSGNVMEWTRDGRGPDGAVRYSLLGGSWNSLDPHWLRASGQAGRATKDEEVGMRCAF
jgi:formylglycine-generating enzyme required for sulfatase activity/TolB-like protein